MAKQLRKDFSELIFVDNPSCALCNRVLLLHDKPLCEKCEGKLSIIAPSTCIRCGAPTTSKKSICANCDDIGLNFMSGFSLMPYDESAKRLIADMKFHSNPACAKYCASLIGKGIRANKFNMDFELITSVPSSAAKLKQRGYNQAELLADELGQSFKISVNNGLLAVIGEPKDQIGLNYEQRKENVKKHFLTEKEVRLTGQNIAIVDDVLTTGATLSACGEALINAGAGSVSFITLAAARFNKEREV